MSAGGNLPPTPRHSTSPMRDTLFVLMDLATHAPGGLLASVPGDTSFIAGLKGKRADAGKGTTSRRKCYYCDEEGHFKERCPTRLKDFLKQRADKGSWCRGRFSNPTNGWSSRTTSPAVRKKQVKFAEASQILPVVAESYGKKTARSILMERQTGGRPVHNLWTRWIWS